MVAMTPGPGDVTCPNCGRESNPPLFRGYRFCASCGSRIEGGEIDFDGPDPEIGGFRPIGSDEILSRLKGEESYSYRHESTGWAQPEAAWVDPSSPKTGESDEDRSPWGGPGPTPRPGRARTTTTGATTQEYRERAREGDWDACREIARSLLQEGVGSRAEAFYALGYAHERGGWLKHAQAAYDAALRIDPTHAKARKARSRL
jgi:hypothetical protein